MQVSTNLIAMFECRLLNCGEKMQYECAVCSVVAVNSCINRSQLENFQHLLESTIPKCLQFTIKT